MANTPADLFASESRMDRLRRELRNPSMLTVIIITALVLAIPLAIFVPKWVSTTQNSLEERAQDTALRDDTMLSITELVPGQVAPWLASHINRMLVADSPFEWTRVSFASGPCLPANLAQLPGGKYSEAIVTACQDMAAAQVEYARECPNVANCNFSAESRAELTRIRTEMFDAFADSGFVLPTRTEQSSTSQ
jgi:hypothetical protein